MGPDYVNNPLRSPIFYYTLLVQRESTELVANDTSNEVGGFTRKFAKGLQGLLGQSSELEPAMSLLRRAIPLTIVISVISLFPDSFAKAQSLDAGWWTQVSVRECGPARSGEDYPDCGDVQSELRNTDTDLGVTGSASSAYNRAQPLSQSAASAGYTGAGFAPAISAYSHSALGDRIITSAFGLQRYEFLSDGELTGTATLTYSQSGITMGLNPRRSPSGTLQSGIIVFQTENDLFEPAKCGVDDLTAGTALLTCLIAEALSQEGSNPPGLVYDGALEFVNNEFDENISQQEAAMQPIPFSVTGEPGDIFFLTGDVFIFANNGGFGDSRTTLKIELDNPELVQASFPVETFAPAPQLVDTDIRPYSSKNKIRPRSWGFIPVAIFGSQDFDALQAKIATARFGPNNAQAVRWFVRSRDINHDGFSDLVLLFKTRKTGIQCGDTEATLTSDTHLGDSFIGIDSITTIGCN